MLKVLVPPWKGVSYHKSYDSKESWMASGRFGLQGSRYAPLWNPPEAYSPALQAPVRWPWQSVSSHERLSYANHSEIHLQTLVFSLSIYFILGGVITKLIAPIHAPRIDRKIVNGMWRTSGVILFAWGIYTIWMMSSWASGSAKDFRLFVSFIISMSTLTIRRWLADFSQQLSRENQPDGSVPSDEETSLRSWYRALCVTSGVLLGGALGYLACSIIFLLTGSTSSGGPYPGYAAFGSAILLFFCLIISALLGGVICFWKSDNVMNFFSKRK